MDIGCKSDNATQHDDSDDLILEWSKLHIVNITKLIVKKMPEIDSYGGSFLRTTTNRPYYLGYSWQLKTTTISPSGFGYGWQSRQRPYWIVEEPKTIPGPLRNVTFENIENAEFVHDLEFPSGINCSKSYTELEHLKFINMNVVDHFRGISKNVKLLKELLLDRVTFTLVHDYTPIDVKDLDAVVKIINSSFISVEEILKGKVSKVIFGF